MVLSMAFNNKKAKRGRLMVYLLRSPRFSTQALMWSDISHIRLSSVSAEMLCQAQRTFSWEWLLTSPGSILLTLSWTIALRFPIDSRSGLLPGHTFFAEKAGKLAWYHH